MTSIAFVTLPHTVLPELLEQLLLARGDHFSAMHQYRLTKVACGEALSLSDTHLNSVPADLRAHLQAMRSASQQALALVEQRLATAREKLDDYLVTLLQQYPACFSRPGGALGVLTVPQQKVPDVHHEFLVHNFQSLEVFEAQPETGGPLRFVIQLSVTLGGRRTVGLFEGTQDSLCYIGGLSVFEDLAD